MLLVVVSERHVPTENHYDRGRIETTVGSRGRGAGRARILGVNREADA